MNAQEVIVKLIIEDAVTVQAKKDGELFNIAGIKMKGRNAILVLTKSDNK